jgi:hypothetical protein
MPVVGTPIIDLVAQQNSCDSQATQDVQVTNFYGIPLPTKRRAVAIPGGGVVAVRIQLFDPTGNPVDITDCGGQAGTVTVRMREIIAPASTDFTELPGEIDVPTEGIIFFTIPTTISNTPGVYLSEIGVFDGADNLMFTNQLFIWVNSGLFSTSTYNGPPTLDEIRLFIRDNAPEENLLLDDFEFDLAEICQAAANAVRYWNEASPDVGLYFTTVTYCARHKWLQAIGAHMLIVAAHRFRRNHMPYQAGGVAVDDQNKFQLYDQAGTLLMQEYKEWVKLKKVAINCFAAISTSGSPYGSYAYQIINSGV